MKSTVFKIYRATDVFISEIRLEFDSYRPLMTLGMFEVIELVKVTQEPEEEPLLSVMMLEMH